MSVYLALSRPLLPVARITATVETCDNSGSKPAAQSGSAAFVPALRFNQVCKRSLTENDPIHLRAASFQFGFNRFPRHRGAAIHIERLEAAIQFRCLRFCQRMLFVVETVPQLRDQREPFRRRQARYFFATQNFHVLRIAFKTDSAPAPAGSSPTSAASVRPSTTARLRAPSRNPSRR